MIETISNILNATWLYYVLMVLYFVSVVSIIGVVLSENRNPVKSLAWVSVLVLLPVVGIILYIFFGRNIKNKHLISRRTRRKLRRRQPPHVMDLRRLGLTQDSMLQIKLAHSLTGAPLRPDNSVEVFTNGRDKFDALIGDLEAATSSINLQYYIFSDDSIGNKIADILMRKARQGVKVRVIYDHVGSFGTSRRFFRRLREAGVECEPFFKVTFPQLATRINWRNHRKICIIDGLVGYLGGMNIADRYIDGGTFDAWRDTHVRVTGPVVASLQFSVAVDWNSMGRGLIEECADYSDHHLAAAENAIHGVSAQLLTSGPTSQWSNVAYAFHKAIAGAKRRIFIQTPYFLPTEGLLKALQTAALAHVDVRIMLPARSDSRMLTHASASYIAECLRAGIKIYLYQPGMLHSKMILIDDEISSIGSTNFDFRSFEHNFESNLFFYSRPMATHIEEVYRTDLGACRRITPSDWARRPMHVKAAESMIRLLSPIL